MTFDWFVIFPAALVIIIAVYIFRASRQVKAKIDQKIGPAPSELAMKQLLDQIKNRELPKCPRCQSETFAMIDTDSRYKCESCHYEFQGAPHI